VGIDFFLKLVLLSLNLMVHFTLYSEDDRKVENIKLKCELKEKFMLVLSFIILNNQLIL